MSDEATTAALHVIKRSKWSRGRFAASAFFGLLTIAVCVVWARSYVTFDRAVVRFFPNGVTIASHRGSLYTVLLTPCYHLESCWECGPAITEPQFLQPWEGTSILGFALIIRGPFNAMPNDPIDETYPVEMQNYGLTGRSYTDEHVNGFVIPHYFLAAAALTATILSHYQLLNWPRFSLRTLLIATTLLAVLLGLVAWAER